MSQPNFTDPSIQPDEQRICSVIGDKQVYWKELMQDLSETYPDVSLEWKYYRDAKSWLLPVAVKKKNLCWITIAEGTFRVSFWFGNKAGGFVENSDLPESIKEEYRKAKQNKMGRGILIPVKGPTDVKKVMKLLEFKSTLK